MGYKLIMLRLFVLRHANTAWALPGQRDKDRQLNADGLRDLDTIADWISANDLRPGHVYCSTAVRTRATLEGISRALEPVPDIAFLDAMYDGYTDHYLEAVRAHGANEDLLMVGHNPSCAGLVSTLISPEDIQGQQRASYSFPTGSLAVLEFPIDAWSDLKPASGTLRNFFVPDGSQRYQA